MPHWLCWVSIRLCSFITCNILAMYNLTDQFKCIHLKSSYFTDTKFHLQIWVTEGKELQIRVSIQVPFPDPVRAVVCFTYTGNKELQHHYVTSSSQANSTLFFLLHFPDIPQDVRDGSFKVQIALKVGLTEGPLVPSSLEEADTRSDLTLIEQAHKSLNEVCIIILSSYMQAKWR